MTHELNLANKHGREASARASQIVFQAINDQTIRVARGIGNIVHVPGAAKSRPGLDGDQPVSK